MAKIEWGSIEGYREDMTPEEKLELLNDYELPEPPTPPVEKTDNWKKQFDKVSSELAATKKQLRSRMTEEEARDEERKANEESMRIELEQLRKEKLLSNYRAEHLSQGYDEQLAAEAAEALADGDMDAYFKVVRKQTTISAKAMKAQILKDTPVPPAGDEVDLQKQKEQKEIEQLRHWMGLK